MKRYEEILAHTTREGTTNCGEAAAMMAAMQFTIDTFNQGGKKLEGWFKEKYGTVAHNRLLVMTGERRN